MMRTGLYFLVICFMLSGCLSWSYSRYSGPEKAPVLREYTVDPGDMRGSYTSPVTKAVEVLNPLDIGIYALVDCGSPVDIFTVSVPSHQKYYKEVVVAKYYRNSILCELRWWEDENGQMSYPAKLKLVRLGRQ